MKKEKIDHINYALVAKPHTPMYLMHKFWARKPHNVVSAYIKNYSKEGDIVLDPFSGSGPTPIEAIKIGRKSIGIDLDPMATFITRMTAIPINVSKIKSSFESIKNTSQEQIEALYKTKCRNCQGLASIICTHWKDLTPITIYYFCPICNNKYAKKPDDEDLKLIIKINKLDIPYWVPTQRLAYNKVEFKEGTHDPNIDSVDKLFTKRNLISLSILFNHINKIKDRRLKEIFLFSFTSMSHLASKMTPVRPSRPMSSFWAMHRYWVPPVFMESNVWHLFESSVFGPQGIIEGKKDSENQIKDFKEAKKYGDLKKGANFFIKTGNVLDLTKFIPENSVDYIFTDPPYGGSVQYFELSTLWASWLTLKLDFKNEITINTNQKKDFDYYHKMLTAAFKESYRVLKTGKYLTVTFHSTDIKVWTSIIKAVVLSGFDLEKIIYQPPARPSAKGLLQPYGSAVGDYYIRFRRPAKEKKLTPEEISQERYERIVVECTKKILAERGEPTIYQHLLNGIIVELKSEGALLSGQTNPEDVMKKYVDKEFVLIDVLDENGKKVGKKWWLKNPGSIPYLELVPLEDRVETAIVDVLHRKVSVNFDDILQEIFIKFPNALTPETHKINRILSEYADKTNGKWILKPIVQKRESQHTYMIFILANLGKKAGYDIWIGQREQGESYDNVKLSELCTSKDPVFRFIPSQNIDRVKQIDVIWYKEGKIFYAYEVEHTTAITEAMVRGSNIPENRVQRYIVVPEERESLLFRKMREPMLQERWEESKWKFIFYKDLLAFFDKSKKRTKINDSEIDSIISSPSKKTGPKQLKIEFDQ